MGGTSEFINLLFVMLISVALTAGEFLSSRVIYAVNCGWFQISNIVGFLA